MNTAIKNRWLRVGQYALPLRFWIRFNPAFIANCRIFDLLVHGFGEDRPQFFLFIAIYRLGHRPWHSQVTIFLVKIVSWIWLRNIYAALTLLESV